MDITQNASERVARAIKGISQILEEESCTIEPSVVIIGGKIVETEINVIAKILVPEKTQEVSTEAAIAQPEQKKEEIS